MNKFTYNNFKTRPFMMDLFLLDLIFHVVYFTRPLPLTMYKKYPRKGKVSNDFSLLIESDLQVSLELQQLP